MSAAVVRLDGPERGVVVAPAVDRQAAGLAQQFVAVADAHHRRIDAALQAQNLRQPLDSRTVLLALGDIDCAADELAYRSRVVTQRTERGFDRQQAVCGHGDRELLTDDLARRCALQRAAHARTFRLGVREPGRIGERPADDVLALDVGALQRSVVDVAQPSVDADQSDKHEQRIEHLLQAPLGGRRRSVRLRRAGRRAGAGRRVGGVPIIHERYAPDARRAPARRGRNSGRRALLVRGEPARASGAPSQVTDLAPPIGVRRVLPGSAERRPEWCSP